MFILILCGLCLGAKAQDTLKLMGTDTTTVVLTHWDSVRLYWKPDAMRAVWMGAVIPGYGQIYNRSYWKLPIVYGAFFGCAYALIWTQGKYNDYKSAYRDIQTDINNNEVTEDPGKTYIAILPEGYTLSRVGGPSSWCNTLKNKQNSYRRYRDLSIFAFAGMYLVAAIDAYVDAELSHFDISPDLSLRIEPNILIDHRGAPTAGFSLALCF